MLHAPATGEVLLSSTRDEVPRRPADAVIDVEVAPGFRVVGHGAEIMGVNREFADTLATAVVRAWESQELVAEQERSARLAEIDRARATLLASIGHDLRTPLAGMRVSGACSALFQRARAMAVAFSSWVSSLQSSVARAPAEMPVSDNINRPRVSLPRLKFCVSVARKFHAREPATGTSVSAWMARPSRRAPPTSRP